MNNIKRKIVIGSGNTTYAGWENTQESELNLLDRLSFEAKFKPNSIDAILAEHVWEHLTLEEGLLAATLCFEFIKPGGYLRCAVPDANFRNDEYQKLVQVGGPGPKDHPAASHKIVYDYKTFISIFKKAGFVVELLEYCDELGVFNFNYWNEEDGMIGRSYRFDTRNTEESLGMVSIIIDAKKSKQIG